MYDNFNEMADNISQKNADMIPAMSYGKVIQNYDDDHPKKVKVQLRNIMSDENNEIWADVLFNYAGDGYGEYIMPEIDSEVLVAFVMNNRSLPVVIGNIYSPQKNLVADTANKENSVKNFVTKNGNSVVVKDTADKSSISVKTAKGLEIFIDDENNRMSLSDKDKTESIIIDFAGKNISVDAKEKISLKIDGKDVITIDKQSVNIEAKQFSVKSDSKIQLSGGQAAVEGTDINLKSKGNLSVKANGNLSAEATGMAKLKGSLLNLN